MIPDLNIHEWKIVGSGVTALGAAVVDGVAAPEGSWESIGIKTLLILAIIYLGRELSKQRESEAAAGRERERKIQEVVEKNTQASVELKKTLDQQASYFETVAQTLLNKFKDKP